MTNSGRGSNFHPFPRDRTIHSFFEEMAAKYPKRIAVEFGVESINYCDLNKAAEGVAVELLDHGVSAHDVVAVSAERSIHMMAAIIGILKVGAVYLPIDIDLPEERKLYCIQTANARLVLGESDDETLFGLQNLNIHKLFCTKPFRSSTKVTSDSLAYIIFTSGSTGKPKGVMVRHYSVVNRLLWMKENYGFNKDDVFLQKTPCSFDVSVWELFLWFFCGAKLVLLNTGSEGNIEYLLSVICSHGVTACHFVPSMLNVFLGFLAHRGHVNRVACLKKVFSSGEALKYDTVVLFNELLTEAHSTQLHNLYGPTEATVDVTYFDCTRYRSDDGIVPIGKPIWNMNVYILDENGRVCLEAEKGEMYISGIGVAKGYVGNPELTNKVFVPDPFRPGALLYRTGDIGRWNKGNIEFLGRVDNQVQIHGNRIELEEIENQLHGHDSVDQSIVVVIGDDEKKLVAFYTGEEVSDASVLSDYLLKKLPKYMVPIEYIFHERFPLNRSGKVDRRELETLYKNNEITVSEGNEIVSEIMGIIGMGFNVDDELSKTNIDSITFIKMVVALEARFGFEFDDEKLIPAEFFTIQSIVEYVECKVKEARPSPN